MTDGPPPLRTAEVIAVGSELLGSTRLETNSLIIAELLDGLGIELRSKVVVGDNLTQISALFREALARSDLIVFTGGLGPTDDDLTRDAVSSVLGLPMQEDQRITAKIQDRFARRGMRMPDVNRRQAMVPRGAVWLDNPHGTAPGLFIDGVGENGDRAVLLLPGPPRELKPMLTALCEGTLAARASAERIHRVSMFVTGTSESRVEEMVQPIYSGWRSETPPIETTILATPGQIELHLSLRSADLAFAADRLTRARAELVDRVGSGVFSLDGRVMEEIVGAQLLERGLTIAAAESCTGGLFTSRLTDVPGSSAYVLGGVVAYSNQTKTAVLGVPPELIAEHGAVSEPVATAMAQGICARTGASIGVGITGVAGPGGGTASKPVGMVAVAVIGRDGSAHARTFNFPGGRAQVKFQATQSALDMVRRLLQSGPC